MLVGREGEGCPNAWEEGRDVLVLGRNGGEGCPRA